MKKTAIVFIAAAVGVLGFLLNSHAAELSGISAKHATFALSFALFGLYSGLMLDTWKARRQISLDDRATGSSSPQSTIPALVALTKELTNNCGNLSIFLTAACECFLTITKVDRVNILLCHKNPSKFICFRNISRTEGETSTGEEIDAQACKSYLEHLQREGFLCINDLQMNPESATLVPDHLIDLQTNSFLSIPVVLDDRALGIVQLESGENWSSEDIQFAEAVTCLLSKALQEFELRQIVEELKRTDGTYRSAIENAAGVPYRLRLTDRRYEFIGSGLESLVGIPASEFTLDTMKNMTREVVFTDKTGPSDPLEYVNAFSNGKLSHYRADVRVETPDGRIKWLSDCSIPIYDDSGVVIGSLGILQDVTERKISEDALRVSEEKYRLLVESLNEGLFVEDDNGIITYANRKFCEMLGYERDEILNRSTSDFLTQESLENLVHHGKRRGENENSLEVEWQTKNHLIITALISPIAIPDVANQQTLKISAVVDITRRVKAERAVLEHNEHLRILNEVAKIVTGSRTSKEIAERLLNVIRRSMTCDAFSLCQYVENHDRLVPLCCFDTIDREIVEVTDRGLVEKPDRILSRVIAEREPILIQRGQSQHQDENSEEKCFRFPSVIFVPLVVNERTIGLISIQSNEFHAYTEKNLDLLIAIAQQTGPALEASLLSEKISQSEEQEREFGEKLTRLIKLTNILTSSDSLDTLSRKAVELGRTQLGFDRISLWYMSDKPGIAVGSFGVSETGEVRDERKSRVEYIPGAPMSIILDKTRPWVTVEQAALSDHKGKVVGKGTLAASAIWDGENVIGCLCADNLLSHKKIDDRHARLLRLYGSVIGTLYSRKAAEQALRESDVIYRTAIENASGVPYRLRFEDWNYDFVGSGLQTILNIKPDELDYECFQKMVREMVVADSQGPTDPERYKSAFLSGKLSLYRMDLKVQLKDESNKWLNDTQIPYYDNNGKMIGVLGILQDITQRKKAEEERHRLESQIQHSQKLESLGILAGGIAHDFNNLLMGILGNADLALMEVPTASPARENMKQIETAALRAADLTRQMLAYSGKGQFMIQPLNLSKLIEEMAHLLEVSISKKAILRYDFKYELPSVQADPSQLRQVFMNLITNASDALEDNSGIITIRTDVIQVDRYYFANTYLNENLPEGTYVFAEISDTGCGMTPEVQAKIFDPFFTTKFTGRGLGLAAVLGIVRGHQGAIRVYSNDNLGTTFKVLFPCSDEEAIPFKIDEAELGQWRGQGTILIVDDEEIVLAVARQSLEGAGFEVLVAHDGQEGVDMFKENSGQISAVVLDMTMPCMNGEETFREIRRIRADATVILSSGYNEQEATTRFAGKGLSGFIQKPYRPVELVKQLRSILAKN